MTVHIEKARQLGFCFGVRRALKILDKAAREHKTLATLGPIVHNRTVVNRLAKQGIAVTNDLEQFKGKTIAISSHGISPQTSSQIKSRNLDVIDTTCPTVRSAQKAVKELVTTGFGVIIFGEAVHPEVRGLLGWAGEKAIATLDASELADKTLSKKLGILAQTTQGRTQFADFVKTVIKVTFPGVKELRIINTLCEETQKRQESAVELAQKSDLMIVVGGYNSANTRRLADVCSNMVETHLIESAAEIKKGWLKGKKHIGVTAGASTPDEAIEEVVTRLKNITGGAK